MILTLEVTGPNAETLKAGKRKTFHEAGGTIGRSLGKSGANHWVLPDPQVSSLHAVITFANGVFYIEDRSRNGVFLGSFETRLEAGRSHAITTGDAILIEPYAIQVTVGGGPKAAEPRADDPFLGEFENANESREAPAPIVRQALVPDEASGGELDPLKALNYGRRASPAPRPSHDVAGLEKGSPLEHHYEPPQPAPGPSAAMPIPDDWDKSVIMRPPPPVVAPVPRPSRVSEASSPSAPPLEKEKVSVPSPDVAVPRKSAELPRRAPVSADSASEGSTAGLASVLAGAGLKNVAVTDELARSFGQILRVVVGGLMEVLQARQQAKSEFRMSITTFRPADNNPLKFSANVDDALHNLLVKRNAAYLGPVEAFEDAFDDVRNHQMAMLAGLRVAFEAMLAEFDPDRLQAEFDRQLKTGALVSVPAKLRYWDLYRAKIHDMVRDAETCYRDLFGDEFAQAYEEQLRRLKGQGRTRNVE